MAIVRKAEEGGFLEKAPALPECLTQVDTEEEIRAHLLKAIELWFEAEEPYSNQSGRNTLPSTVR